MAAGAIAGLVAGGIGGRVFMSVLASMNPQAAGVESDDGFTMGRVTLDGTLNLLIVTTVLGAVAGLIWLLVRGLRFGPRWWRTVSMPLGAGIVIGAMLVHADGVDFTLLDPPLLAVVLTVAVPVLAALIATALGDRWIADDRTFWQALPAPAAWSARAGVTALIAFAAVRLAADLRLIL